MTVSLSDVAGVVGLFFLMIIVGVVSVVIRHYWRG